MLPRFKSIRLGARVSVYLEGRTEDSKGVYFWCDRGFAIAVGMLAGYEVSLHRSEVGLLTKRFSYNKMFPQM